MSETNVNEMSFQYAVETSLGVPGTAFKGLEINNPGKFGATIEKVERDFISKKRRGQKGSPVKLESGVEFEGDLTIGSFMDFIEGYCFSTATQVGDTALGVFSPTAVVDGTPDSYTVAASGDINDGTLIYARGFTNTENNGLKTVAAAATGTAINVDETLVAEASPPSNAIVEICGFHGADSDIQIDSSGNLTATALNFTTLGLTVGQALYIGGAAAADQFAIAANSGFVRIAAIAAGVLTLEKRQQAFSLDNGSSKTVQIFFGQFIRDLDSDHASFLKRSFTFEALYPDLGGVGVPRYKYARGNKCDEVTFNLAAEAKATVSYSFVGTDTPAHTSTRDTGASTGLDPVKTVAMNCSADFMRLRIQQYDETGLSTDFINCNLKLANGITRLPKMGQLGAAYLPFGNFKVNAEIELYFTNELVASAVRDNDTISIDFALRNDDGAIHVDLPALTAGGGEEEYPLNEIVKIKIDCSAHEDDTLGYLAGITVFPFVPAAA